MVFEFHCDKTAGSRSLHRLVELSRYAAGWLEKTLVHSKSFWGKAAPTQVHSFPL